MRLWAVTEQIAPRPASATEKVDHRLSEGLGLIQHDEVEAAIDSLEADALRAGIGIGEGCIDAGGRYAIHRVIGVYDLYRRLDSAKLRAQVGGHQFMGGIGYGLAVRVQAVPLRS